jgi:ABC-type phosphate/phosphonate transport system substrate-binding protein
VLIANARMYAVNAEVEARWREVFGWIAKRAGIALEVVDHPAPAPLEALWRRDDLGAAAICGYPLASWREASHPKPAPLAAPVPSPAPFGGCPVYWTDIVVRADAAFERVDDLAGTRFGFTVENSQSGYQAPRRFFAERAVARGGEFFAARIGPLVTPRRVVEALLAGTIDAGPLDAYWHALLRVHEVDTAARLRVVAATAATPIPCFAAAAATQTGMRERIAAAFVDAGTTADLRATREALLLERFDRIDARAYDVLVTQAREIDAVGYTRLA